MTLEALLVWGGLTVAILDSTGYANEVNRLLDRIVAITANAIKKRKSPVQAWMNSYDSWLTIQAIIIAHEKRLMRLPVSLAAQPAIKRRLTSNKQLKAEGHRNIVLRKQLDRVLVTVMAVSTIALTIALGITICSPLWFTLDTLGMSRVYSFIVSGIFTATFCGTFFRTLSNVVTYITEPVLAVIFALFVCLLAIPLSVFRLFPTGYLSALGVCFALPGAIQYFFGG